MRACLRAGRPIHLGRKSVLARPYDLSSRSVHPVSHFVSTSRGRQQAQWNPQRDGSGLQTTLLRLREDVLDKQPVCPVPTSERRDPNAWIRYLDHFLPAELRGNTTDDAGPAESSLAQQDIHEQSQAIATLLFQARKLNNLDLLTHLGFKLGRWQAVHALVNQLLDSTESLEALSIQSRLPSNIDWGSETSLDQLTSDFLEFKPAEIRIKRESLNAAVSETDLDKTTERPLAQELSRLLKRELWQSLGSIILEAADVSPEQSNVAMQYVYQVLARLHHSGSIPDAVYKYKAQSDEDALFRPPGMHLLSTHIMNVLSDTVWRVQEAEISAKAAAVGQKSPFLPFNMGIRQLGSEIWLEFILWCCVEEGYVKEGTWIVQQMKAREGDLAWKVDSWKPLLAHPRSVADTNIDVEDFWHRPGDTPTSRSAKSKRGLFLGLGKRTISAEVIESLMDGAANLVYRGLGYRGYSPGSILQNLNFLQSMLLRSPKGALRPPSRVSNWSVTRMIESRAIDPQADPQALERLLRAQSHIVPPWDSNTPTAEEDLELLEKPQLYDDSAALIGLVEYNLRSYAEYRHAGAAFDMFTWLQELVDSSKLQHIQGFLDEIRQLDNGNAFLSQRKYPSINPGGSSVPQLSLVTLAHVLDLATTSRAFSLGEWLLFSTDVDGPAIPLGSFGDEALAPSILRFAAATRNTELCNQVVKSLTQPVSRNTLKALLSFRITMGEWDRVVTMFEYLRDHKAKAWGESNITALAAIVLRLDRAAKHKGGPSPSDDKTSSLFRAKDILRRVLSGEFNVPPNPQRRSGYQERALYRHYQIFMSLPGPLREVAEKAELKYKPSGSRHILPYVPSVAFHNLLTAVVDIYGSAAGKQLWERWCLSPEYSEMRRLQEGGTARLYSSDELDFRKGAPAFNPLRLAEIQRKAVIPNLNTVRIIAQAAVKEYRLQESQKSTANNPTDAISSPESATPAEVLDFCIDKFRSLRLYEKEIDREVQGHLSRKMKEPLSKKRKAPKHIIKNKAKDQKARTVFA
ncbi:hypothetical protein C8Q69DRAFT_450627 [Paecilomyces variotii]|uniref:Uncharacterized protein n=1 Tax=Byssochlamys spectabilis TaxID=264951 RepID=A0A443I5M0_BYSSP|nr:hypothetical protein C8Q69DRAFT_450627 [Paecilomyces variotii]KAJ9354527.1 hypothetical protein DTO280E4_6885 [Paecilomyces variotii]RWQ99306.1 hypothetical protein C8Q69DRAFT_450627 [Paecilomyces variotii]